MATLLTKPVVRPAEISRASTKGEWISWGARVVLDVVLINLAFLAAYFLRYEMQPVTDGPWLPFTDFDSTRLLLTIFIIGALQFQRRYQVTRGTPFLDEAGGVLSSITLGFALAMVASVALRIQADSRLVLAYFCGFSVLLLLSWRAIYRLVRYQLWNRGIGIERVAVVGEGESARRIMQALSERQQLGYRLVGYLGDTFGHDEWTIATQHRVIRAPRLGATEDLSSVVRRLGVDEVFIALPSSSHEQVVRLVTACRESSVRFRLVPDLFEIRFDQVQVDAVNGVPLIGIKANAISGWDYVLKRAVDVALATLALTVGAPLIALIALAIKLDSPGPVIFRQIRVGKDGRQFVCYKFRSMYQDAEQRLAALRKLNQADGPLFKMRDDPRRTRVGGFLRRTSLDELPQVFNILRGDMSWVGPRPAVPQEVAEYEDWHRQRLLVTPGLTGLWQVSGRSNLPFDEMVLLDLYYAEHWSLWLDLKIMLRTVPAVLLARGAY